MYLWMEWPLERLGEKAIEEEGQENPAERLEEKTVIWEVAITILVVMLLVWVREIAELTLELKDRIQTLEE